MSGGSIDSVIDSLTGELEPVKVLAHPVLRILPWVVISVAYLGGVTSFLGMRPDLAVKITDSYWLFEVSVMAFVGLGAALCSSFLCVPDMRGQKWMVVPPLLLLAIFTAWMVMRGMNEDVYLPKVHWDDCFTDALLLGFVPAVMIVFLSKAGATTRPGLMAFMNALAVTAFGYVGLRFTCGMDGISHATLTHLVPFVVLGTLFALGARRIFKW